MIELGIRDGFIKLGQALKAAHMVDNGAEAKAVIQNGEVTVNGESDDRRGRKLTEGDVVTFRGQQIRIVKN